MNRKTLFDKYSKNFELVRAAYSIPPLPDEFKESVACPTCINIFNADCLDQTHQIPLTKEHLPPEKLGGKPLILTCKECNNRSGAKLDSALNLFYKVEPFVAGKDSSIDVKININDEFRSSAKVIRKTENDKTVLHFINNVPPNRMDAFKEALADPGGKSFTFTFPRPYSRLVEIAILRIGYLMAFSKFGHSFLSVNQNRVREQILNPDKIILPSFGVIVQKLPIPYLGFFILVLGDFKCTYVAFEIKHENQKEIVGVMLPPCDVKDTDFYDEYFKLLERKAITDIKYKAFDKPDYLHDPKEISAIRLIYKAMK